MTGENEASKIGSGFRVMPPVILLACILLMMVLHRFVPIARMWENPMTLGGLFPIAVGFGIVLRCMFMFHRNQTTIKPFEESNALITDGPYGWSRNPIYVGMVLVLIGCAIVSGTVLVWVIPPLFMALIQWKFVLAEESMLAMKFGPDFKAYCQQVNRWI